MFIETLKNGIFELNIDIFNGVTINNINKESTKIIDEELNQLIKTLEEEKRNLLWINLLINDSHLVPTFTKYGFKYYSCEEDSIRLLKKLKDDPIIPTPANHTAGVGVIVLNEKEEVLVIKERVRKGGYKFPGGHIDSSEDIKTAAIREVYEETGINIEFEGIVSLGHFYPDQFNKSNLYIICKAKAKDLEINIIDKEEIEDAKWMKKENFLADEEIFDYNKKLLKKALEFRELKIVNLDSFKNIKKECQLFF